MKVLNAKTNGLWSKGDPAQLLCFYTTCIRPMSEYACQVFHNGLPKYLSEELEKIQRRALRIIFPDLDYKRPSKGATLPPSINGANG